MTKILASATVERYGYHLLNLVGSVRAHSDIFDRIVAYDLALSTLQRRLLDGVEGIELETAPLFVPYSAQCFTWKPWISTHSEADQRWRYRANARLLRPSTYIAKLRGLSGYTT